LAHQANPSDAGLASAYAAAKEAFRTFQRGKDTASSWYCAQCGVSMPASGQAAHEQGKLHKKKSATAAVNASKGDKSSLSLAGGLTEADPSAFFECRLCGCTGASSSKAMHERGKKHKAKLGEVLSLWKGGTGLKAGDWVCVQHGFHVQLNYASKTVCHREDCKGSRAHGLSFEEVRQLEVAARTAKQERSSGAAPAAVPVRAGGEDVELKCRECGVGFAFTAKEQTFFEDKGFAQPLRCLECRRKRKRENQE